MKLSKFNSIIEWEDSVLVYNTVSGQLFNSGKEDLIRLKNGDLTGLSALQLNRLKEARIIVKDDESELDYIKYRINSFRFAADTAKFSLVLTYGCNLRCTYCYEADINPAAIAFSMDTAQKVCDYIKRYCKRVHSNNLVITLYGGEPLLKYDVMLFILGQLQQWCIKNNIRFFASLITNGTLLDEQKVSELKPYIHYVQLTLEGSRQVHDSIRKTAANLGTYDRIVENAGLLIRNGINTAIRMQISPDTLDTAGTCLSDLKERGLLGSPHFNYYFFPILDIHSVCSSKSHKCFEKYFDNGMMKKLYKICADYSSSMMVKLPQPVWFAGYCSFINQHAWIIDPDGNLFKCVSLIGRAEHIAGSIYAEDGIQKTQHEKNMLDFCTRSGFNIQPCRECEYLPLCNGGCAFKAFADHGAFDKPYCDMFKGIVPGQIREYHTEKNRKAKSSC